MDEYYYIMNFYSVYNISIYFFYFMISQSYLYIYI